MALLKDMWKGTLEEIVKLKIISIEIKKAQDSCGVVGYCHWLMFLEKLKANKTSLGDFTFWITVKHYFFITS